MRFRFWRRSELPLTINGKPAAEFIKCAYDLGVDLSGPGRFDLSDPIQSELRRIKDWIAMAEHDAIESRDRITGRSSNG